MDIDKTTIKSEFSSSETSEIIINNLNSHVLTQLNHDQEKFCDVIPPHSINHWCQSLSTTSSDQSSSDHKPSTRTRSSGTWGPSITVLIAVEQKDDENNDIINMVNILNNITDNTAILINNYLIDNNNTQQLQITIQNNNNDEDDHKQLEFKIYEKISPIISIIREINKNQYYILKEIDLDSSHAGELELQYLIELRDDPIINKRNIKFFVICS
eukprot:gene9676-11862_t